MMWEQTVKKDESEIERLKKVMAKEISSAPGSLDCPDKVLHTVFSP